MNAKDKTEDIYRVYNAIADEFSGSRQYLWEDLRPLKMYVKEGDSIVDIGCGNGRLVQLFEGMSIAYTGIDQSQALIRHAKEKFPRRTFLVAEMTALPCADRNFDLVYCIAAFHHLPTEQTRLAALQEMYRVVKPKGRVILTNWNLHSQWATKKYGLGDGENNWLIPWKDGTGRTMGQRFYHGFTETELTALFAAAGFNVEEQYFIRRGEKTDAEKGDNIVSVVRA